VSQSYGDGDGGGYVCVKKGDVLKVAVVAAAAVVAAVADEEGENGVVAEAKERQRAVGYGVGE
jgi:hypothetical protein